jgi:peptide/nickel transport system substrate-binding protein
MQARRLKAVAVIAAATAFAVGLAGCAKSQRNSSTAASGGTLIFAGAGDPKNFDPIWNDEGESLRVIRQVYDTLIMNKPGTANIEPALAASWEHDSTGKVWTFHLRSGVKFQDGTPFNAAAVCFNFDRWYNMKGAAAQSVMSYYTDVFEGFAHNAAPDLGSPVYNNCKASDDGTAVITLNKYKGAFPGAFTLASFSISSPTALQKYSSDTVTQAGDAFTYNDYADKNPTGTGPFKFQGWDKSTDQITLVRNDGYWGEKPKLDKMIIKVIKDSTTRKQELKAGTVDAIDFPTPADTKELASAGLNVLTRPAFNILYLGLNQKSNPKLADLRVRQAIAYAINRQQLADTIGPQGSKVADQFLPPSVSGYADSVQPYPYDPNKAKELLAAAGATGMTLQFYYPTDVSRPYMPDPSQIYQAIANDLKAVGINVVGTGRPWNGGYKTDVQQLGKPDAHILGWTGDYNDAGNFVATFFGRAKPDFGDQAMTDMFRAIAQANAEVDDAKKKAAWQQVNRDVAAKWLPAVPIWFAPPPLVTSKKVSGLVPSPLTDERFNTVSVSK